MDKTKKPHSYHVFLFPFAWNYFQTEPNLGSSSFESRTKLSSFDSLLDKAIWQTLDFGRDAINYYNDFAFFHTSVREAVFGKPNGDSQMVRNYERMGAKGGTYEIKVKKRVETYRLSLEQIRLNVYDTGIGIISFYLSNHEYPEWQQVLEINDYGRRFYPQFLDTPSLGEGGNLLDAAHNAFLAEQILVLDAKGRVIFSEDFTYVQNLLNTGLNNPGEWSFLSSKIINGLFGSLQFRTSKQDTREDCAVIEPILDDRMFVITWYGNKDASDEMISTYLDPSETDMWMQYMFVDNSGNSCQSKRMRQRFLEQHTYDRWANYGTFYGVTRYSLVALTDTGEFAYKHLINHIKGRYLELAQLSLAQRASCQRFSYEINNLANLDEKPMKQEADFVYQEYLRFINKLYFPEASPQEQGIELYALLQQHMKIKDDVDFLNSELTDLYEFLNLRENGAQSKAANQFAWVATVFLPASLVAAVFGFSTITENLSFWGWPPNAKFWIPFGLTLLAILVALWVLRRIDFKSQMQFDTLSKRKSKI